MKMGLCKCTAPFSYKGRCRRLPSLFRGGIFLFEHFAQFFVFNEIFKSAHGHTVGNIRDNVKAARAAAVKPRGIKRQNAARGELRKCVKGLLVRYAAHVPEGYLHRPAEHRLYPAAAEKLRIELQQPDKILLIAADERADLPQHGAYLEYAGVAGFQDICKIRQQLVLKLGDNIRNRAVVPIERLAVYLRAL